MKKKVIIIGGGIVGCLSALEFKKRGFNVTIIEKSSIGQESSSAAAGILYPLMPWKYDAKLYDLSINAFEFYEDLSKQFLKVLDLDIELIVSGLMILPPYIEHEVIEWAKKNNTKILKNNNSLLIPGVSQLNPSKLMSAFREYLINQGIEIYENSTVSRIESKKNNINAVQTSNDKQFTGDFFIIAAGAWTSIIYKKIAKKIKPIRGQIIQYAAKNLLIENILYSDGIYIFQRKDGSIITGSTLEDVGFSNRNLDEKLEQLDTKAKKILDDLNYCSIEKTWFGFRPGVEDNLPIIFKDENYENMFVHSGHFRYGITMAPATTKILMRYF